MTTTTTPMKHKQNPLRVGSTTIGFAIDITLADLLQSEPCHDEVISFISNVVKRCVAEYDVLNANDRKLTVELMAINSTIDGGLRQDAFERLKGQRAIYRN